MFRDCQQTRGLNCELITAAVNILPLNARAGATAASYQGTIVPSHADELGGAVSLQGKDLSQLYPLIPVALPWTPPYRLSGELKHTGGVWSMQQIKGKVQKGVGKVQEAMGKKPKKY